MAESGGRASRDSDWSQRPLGSYSREWQFLLQQIVDIPPTKPARGVPQGMVRVPASEFDFHVTGMEIEGFNWIGLDVQYPWEDAPRRSHRKLVTVKPFYIDRFPVTNAEFKRFPDAARCRPADNHNFLKDWKDGSIPSGWANRSVTWVSLEDARGHSARRQLLHPARRGVVLSTGIPARPARPVPAHGAVQRSLWNGRVPLRDGCGVME